VDRCKEMDVDLELGIIDCNEFQFTLLGAAVSHLKVGT
jgi:hypothetical protein